MIRIYNLTKNYKRRVSEKNRKYKEIIAVDHINLSIAKGEILGLIGPNGAGKTTTLKILSTLIIPDEGKITIDGYDVVEQPDKVKQRIGLLAGEFNRSLYWRITGRKNLEFFAKIKEIKEPEKRIDELVEMFNLKEYQNEQVMKYSTGMKHKLALAIVLLSDPPVLLLDEPLTGIDPVTSYEIKNIIKNKFKNKTIIWASHNLYEIEEMCDKIALINNGKIVVEGKTEDLKKTYWGHKKIIIISDNVNIFRNLPNVEIKDDFIEIKADNIGETIIAISKIVKKYGIKITDIKTTKPSLEDIVMEKIKNA
jgi:ABC-type multidrug transport system ATPase subunit